MTDLNILRGYEPYRNLRKTLERNFNRYEIDAGSVIIVFRDKKGEFYRKDDYYVVSCRGALLKIEREYPCNLNVFHPRTVLNEQNSPLGWIVDKRKDIFYLGNCVKRRRHLDRLIEKVISCNK